MTNYIVNNEIVTFCEFDELLFKAIEDVYFGKFVTAVCEKKPFKMGNDIDFDTDNLSSVGEGYCLVGFNHCKMLIYATIMRQLWDGKEVELFAYYHVEKRPYIFEIRKY